jgi:hypothetical protein
MTRPISHSEGSSALARRLKELRESRFSKPVTQRRLAEVLGGDKPLSISSISAYENPSAPPPPESRLRDYAVFFATERSLVEGRLLPEDELTTEERSTRDALLEELLTLVEPPASRSASQLPHAPILLRPERRGPTWLFPEREAVRIVCGELLDMNHPYADPRNRNYTELLRFSDLDALVELFGHVRMLNPTCDVRFMLDREFIEPDDMSSHVVILGGSGLNRAIQRMIRSTELPIQQRPDSKEVPEGDAFDLRGTSKQFLPSFDDELGLVEDVGLFARLVNPFNGARTLTICSGIFSPGVQGAVRTLTDAKSRDRNEMYLRTQFAYARQFAVLMRVPVVGGKAVTPDLHKGGVRLHEWSDSGDGPFPGDSR